MDLTRPLRKALVTLQAERARSDQEIAGVEQALAALSGIPQATKGRPKPRRTPRRGLMSATARKALSQRMKAYWAKRRETAATAKTKAGK